MEKFKLSTGIYAYGNRTAYTELVKFAESRIQLSESDNTEQIDTIERTMSRAIGYEIPLPSIYYFFRNCHLNVMFVTFKHVFKHF